MTDGTLNFRALFEAAPEPLLVLAPDARRTIVAANDACLRATRTRRDDIVGRGLVEVFPANPGDPGADGASDLQASIALAIVTRAPDVMTVRRCDVRMPPEEGGGFEERWWTAVIAPVLDAAGAVAHVILRADDVTNFVRLRRGRDERDAHAAAQARVEAMEAEVFEREQELQAAHRRLGDAHARLSTLFERARELDELKTRFFANVSHDLRTPLALILGPATRLLDAPDTPPAAREGLALIARNARLLLRHVNDLLDLSKLDAGVVDLRYAEVDLVALARFVADHFGGVASDRSVTLALDAPRELVAQVDADKVRRVFLNLLANAFRFAPTGGTVRVTLREADDRCVIEVADDGAGVPPDRRATVFDRYGKAGAGGPSGSSGAGLGLAIVREFVTLHGGAVTVTDAPEGGALFVVSLPLRAPRGAVVAGRGAAEPHAATTDLRHAVEALRDGRAEPTLPETPADAPRALVVEDNPEMRRFVAEGLAAGGAWRVATAAGGTEGLARAIADPPDLVVTDIMMPEMDGDDLVRAMRGRPELAATPIVVLTARDDDATRLRLLRAGAQDYLTKPFSLDELRVRAGNLVARKRAEEHAERAARQIEEVSRASAAVSEAVAGLPEASVDAVLKTIALAAQRLTGAQYVAVGIGTDPERAFAPWVVVGVEPEQAARIGHPPRPVGVLGLVMTENRELRVRDVRAHPAHRGMPPHHPEMRSLLGVPIRHRGHGVGNLYLANKRGGDEFTEQDQHVVAMLAARVGGAIETARLYQSEGAGRAWLQAVIDQMPEGVMLLDADARAITQSRSLREKYDVVQAVAQDVAQAAGPIALWHTSGEPVPRAEHPAVRAITRGETLLGVELVAQRPGGERVPVLVSAAPVHLAGGAVAGAALLVQDITPLKELERLREEWTAIVAHDLRDPTNAIVLTTGLLLRGPLGEQQRAEVERIRRAAERLGRMINDLLDASQIETKRLRVEPRRIDLCALLRDLVSRAPEYAERAALELPAETSLWVRGDAGRLEQVFSNLINNATKYSEAGSPIRVTVARTPTQAIVGVINRGPGIRAADLPHLFDRYVRTGAARRSAVEGTGLGLYIVKGLVEAHGGVVRVESTPGETTAFHVTLPLDPA